MARHDDLIRTARRHAARPTPVLGGPWWAYAVPFAAANGLRQLLLPGLETWQQVATFVATRGRGRRGRRVRLAPVAGDAPGRSMTPRPGRASRSCCRGAGRSATAGLRRSL